MALLLFCVIGCILYFSLKHTMHGKENKLVNLLTDWNQMVLEIESRNDAISVPVSSKFFGYFGFIPYLCQNYKQNHRFSNLYGTLELSEKKDTIQVMVSINKAYSNFIQTYYAGIPKSNIEKVKNLELNWAHKLSSDMKNKMLVGISEKYGLYISGKLYEWSSKDSIGHRAFLHNFAKEYKPPSGESLWKENPDHPMPALQPYWGKSGTFIIKTENYVAHPLPHDILSEDSEVYRNALELFTISSPLSNENKWVGEFWSDDVRGLTFTPVGRWISILNQILKNNKVEDSKVVEAYFKLGLGLADAITACWKSKYIYNLERPESYIRKNFHDGWRPFHEAPNFPSYPSGHAVLGAVSAEVLSSVFGEKLKITDNSHKDRNEFMGKPRTFQSLREMANENAYSRIALGVHYRIDCQEGMRLGTEVGKQVNKFYNNLLSVNIK